VPDSEQWYFFGLPFAVKRITDTSGKELAIGTGDNDGYAIAYYNGVTRASNGSGGWTDITTAPTAEAPLSTGGYIFWVNDAKVQDKTLILESDANSITVSNSTTSSVEYFTGNAGDIHQGWNLITNPLFSTATATLETGQFHYAYNYSDDSYTVSDNSVTDLKPFDSFFVKTAAEKESVSFTSATT
ncbi:MAG: hypothetical protein LBB85_08045, partial [Dysgonamonadaceae bacterium]|nr:hypothetical protein [Dysgonamonadaceae bacterium]